MLWGFWRGFRSDELADLRVEIIEVTPGEGMTFYLDPSKGDRQPQYRVFICPALSRLCSVTAFNACVDQAGLSGSPVFISCCEVCLSKHALIHRRSTAGVPFWARANGWDIKDLMEYVCWKDAKSAMCYLDAPSSGLKARFEQLLAAPMPADLQPIQPRQPAPESTQIPHLLTAEDASIAIVRVTMSTARFSKQSRGLARGAYADLIPHNICYVECLTDCRAQLE